MFTHAIRRLIFTAPKSQQQQRLRLTFGLEFQIRGHNHVQVGDQRSRVPNRPLGSRSAGVVRRSVTLSPTPG